MNASPVATLEVRNVSLSFKGVKAISDLTFQVEREESAP